MSCGAASCASTSRSRACRSRRWRELLEYQGPTSFSHAFKRWTGRSRPRCATKSEFPRCHSLAACARHEFAPAERGKNRNLARKDTRSVRRASPLPHEPDGPARERTMFSTSRANWQRQSKEWRLQTSRVLRGALLTLPAARGGNFTGGECPSWRQNMRKIGISLAALAVAGAMSLSSGGAANAGTLSINYYETPSLPTSTPAGTNDFGTCCSSPPATLEGITVGALLGPDGLPVNQGNVIDVNGLGEILWWSPPRLGASSPNQITYTGSGHFTVGTVASPYTSNMFAPNSMGTNDGTKFETAVLLGTLTGHGADVELKWAQTTIRWSIWTAHMSAVTRACTARRSRPSISGRSRDRNDWRSSMPTARKWARCLASASPAPRSLVPSTWAMMLAGLAASGLPPSVGRTRRPSRSHDRPYGRARLALASKGRRRVPLSIDPARQGLPLPKRTAAPRSLPLARGLQPPGASHGAESETPLSGYRSVTRRLTSPRKERSYLCPPCGLSNTGARTATRKSACGSASPSPSRCCAPISRPMLSASPVLSWSARSAKSSSSLAAASAVIWLCGDAIGRSRFSGS